MVFYVKCILNAVLDRIWELHIYDREEGGQSTSIFRKFKVRTPPSLSYFSGSLAPGNIQKVTRRQTEILETSKVALYI